MTAALLMPLLFGLLSHRAGAVHARVAIVVSIVATGGLLVALQGSPDGAWLPSVTGVALAAVVLASAWVPGAGASIEAER